MWPPWRRSPRRSPASVAAASSPAFSFTTFKDIQSLLSDDNDNKPASASASATAACPAPRKATSVFRRACSAASALRSWSSLPTNFDPPDPDEPHFTTTTTTATAGAEDGKSRKIVLYYTSLRVVRKTFEDCRAVRSILRGLRVVVDERDVSICRQFMEELEASEGGGGSGAAPPPRLPRVFIGGRCLGGAEEIRQMNESGELRRMVEGFPREKAGGAPCEGCGGARFVLCGECHGSHKCHLETGPGFRSCPSCNENGLVRCPICCTDSCLKMVVQN